MAVINFSHPMTERGLQALDALLGTYSLTEVKVQMEWTEDVKQQLDYLAQIALESDADWVILPGLSIFASYITARLVQAKTGMEGANLGIIVMGKVQDMPPKFEPIEAIWLIRDGKPA